MPRDEIPGLRAAQLRLGRLPGYVRRPDLSRRKSEDGHTYKKGWEVRFTARTEAEIAEIRDLVVAAGFAPARPFFKGHQLIQPVYGIAAVQAYLAAREAMEELARTRDGDTFTGDSEADTAAVAAAGTAAAGAVAFPGQTRREAAAPLAAAAAAAAAVAAATAAAASTDRGTGADTGTGTPSTAVDPAPAAVTGAHGRRAADRGISSAGRTS
ncbi:hypothetical protein [Kitasatospora sp. NBC_01539]|uniref:hypothetical protein n=1 Tax=Kitasatospora sp. NBC_01539 TaxID=2903577 RepID=UPI0038601AE8